MLPAPRVTIGIPAFNNGGTIMRTIRSVQAQTFGNWRILISDDASDDDTASIALREAARDRRISVIRQPKRLGYMNFDHVLKRAETPYFAWLAADDRWERRFLEATLAVLDTRPGAVSALPACTFDGSNDTPPDTSTLTGHWAEKASAFMAQPNGTRMYGLFRREPLAASFPARPMHGYDWLLVIRVLRQGDQIGVPETLLRRARTDWRHYARSAAEQRGSTGPPPVLDMTLHGLLRGQIPLGSLRSVWRLNLQKHAEQTFLEAPDVFLKRAGLYRRLGVEAASAIYSFDDIARRALAEGRAGTATNAWLEGIHCPEARPATYYRNAAQALLAGGNRDEALRLLQTAADRGEAGADLVLRGGALGGLAWCPEPPVCAQPFPVRGAGAAKWRVEKGVSSRIPLLGGSSPCTSRVISRMLRRRAPRPLRQRPGD